MCVVNKGTATVFENHRKSLIQHCEQSELRLHFELIENAPNGLFWRVYENEVCGQTVLPDWSLLVRQKSPKCSFFFSYRLRIALCSQ